MFATFTITHLKDVFFQTDIGTTISNNIENAKNQFSGKLQTVNDTNMAKVTSLAGTLTALTSEIALAAKRASERAQNVQNQQISNVGRGIENENNQLQKQVSQTDKALTTAAAANEEVLNDLEDSAEVMSQGNQKIEGLVDSGVKAATATATNMANKGVLAAKKDITSDVSDAESRNIIQIEASSSGVTKAMAKTERTLNGVTISADGQLDRELSSADKEAQKASAAASSSIGKSSSSAAGDINQFDKSVTTTTADGAAVVADSDSSAQAMDFSAKTEEKNTDNGLDAETSKLSTQGSRLTGDLSRASQNMADGFSSELSRGNQRLGAMQQDSDNELAMASSRIGGTIQQSGADAARRAAESSERVAGAEAVLNDLSSDIDNQMDVSNTATGTATKVGFGASQRGVGELQGTMVDMEREQQRKKLRLRGDVMGLAQAGASQNQEAILRAQQAARNSLASFQQDVAASANLADQAEGELGTALGGVASAAKGLGANTMALAGELSTSSDEGSLEMRSKQAQLNGFRGRGASEVARLGAASQSQIASEARNLGRIASEGASRSSGALSGSLSSLNTGLDSADATLQAQRGRVKTAASRGNLAAQGLSDNVSKIKRQRLKNEELLKRAALESELEFEVEAARARKRAAARMDAAEDAMTGSAMGMVNKEVGMLKRSSDASRQRFKEQADYSAQQLKSAEKKQDETAETAHKHLQILEDTMRAS